MNFDGNTALIVHCGTNDLAVENEDPAATNLRMLINDLKPKTKSLAILAVMLRNDSFASKQMHVLLTTGIYWPITSTEQIYISTAMGAKFLGATFVDT